MNIPAATETLREATDPVDGILQVASHLSSVSRRSPRSSLPTTSSQGRSAAIRSRPVSACSDAPRIQTFAVRARSSARLRLAGKLNGTCSTPPDATSYTVSVSGAERSRVIRMPRTPKKAAVRKIAPTLCGSCTRSSASQSPSAGTFAKSSCTGTARRSLTTASAPRARPVRFCLRDARVWPEILTPISVADDRIRPHGPETGSGRRIS